MKKIILPATLLALTLAFDSCKKDKNTPPVYTVPATYNFANVDVSNQKSLLLMADQIVAAINKGNTANTVVSAQKLKDMFNNTGNYFTDSGGYVLNGTGLKLADYCSPTAKADLMNYFDSIALYSQSTVTAGNGVAGVVASSVTPSKKYLLSPTGIFYSQVVKKTIMGGICAYEIANVYLKDSVSLVDNQNVVTGKGSKMEHNWDAAFGFFSVPVDFPTNKTGTKYLSSYSNQVDAGLHSNTDIMNAYIKGRAAISAKDYTVRDAQSKLLISYMDRLNAACIVQEMKEVDVDIDGGDFIAAYGVLGETLGFIRNFRYDKSATRVITDAQIAQLEALLDASNPGNPNMYNFVNAGVNTTAQIKAKTDAIRQLIGAIYKFNASDLALL